MKPVVFVLTLLVFHFALGCTETSLKTEADGDIPGTPCTSDLDCKGERICEDGVCKAPDIEGDGDWEADPDQSVDDDRGGGAGRKAAGRLDLGEARP